MEPLRGRMDFELETLPHELVAQIEERVNAEVAAARPRPGPEGAPEKPRVGTALRNFAEAAVAMNPGSRLPEVL